MLSGTAFMLFLGVTDDLDCLFSDHNFCHASCFMEFAGKKISHDTAVLCCDMRHGGTHVAARAILDTGSGVEHAVAILGECFRFCFQ